MLDDTPTEIQANKLCAILSRSEVRDLVDLAALERFGLPVDERAIAAASRKDAGLTAGGTFSINVGGRRGVIEVKTTDSLSAIAQEVTGSKWNGFLFFGIADAAAKGKSLKPERRNGGTNEQKQ